MKKRKVINRIIALICCLFVFGTYILLAMSDGVTETTVIPVQDGIRIMVNDTVYITENDSVVCKSSIIDGLISSMDNDFTFRGVEIKKNHPNYGIFQDAAERYFNDVKLMYIRTPKNKIVSDKQKDINEYGVPSDRKIVKKENGSFELILKWNGHVNTYDEYGKRLYTE